mgnify:CR=1 FL=1
MSDDREVFLAAAELIESGEPFVLITVVQAKGSTPRNAGARMIWRPSPINPSPNGASGTVGGGQFEHLVIDAARTCFEHRKSMLEHFVLGADADQCCGGTLDVFLEYHGRPSRVVIFGAGHVAHALAGLLSHGSVELIIVDDRTEWSSPARFTGARCVRTWREGIEIAHERSSSTIALVMTCSHDTDFDILRDLLTPAEYAPVFTGLIGSRSKRVCLFGRLVASGLDEKVVQAIHCPIGVGDTGKQPYAVAISIAAQVLMKITALSAQRTPAL